METLTKVRRIMAYACVLLLGSIALAALTTILDLKDELWKRTVVNIAHIIWGGILTWVWLWFVVFKKQSDHLDDINRRMIDVQQRLNDTLERINQANHEPPPEPRQVDIEL